MSGPRKLVIGDALWAPYAGEFRKRLGDGWRVVDASDPSGMAHELEAATALLATRMPAEALPHTRDLRLFLYPGAGLLSSDPADYPAGCPVVNVYEHETPIAEYVLMTMLLHVTRLLPHLESFRDGRWDGSGRVGGVPHAELAGCTVGIFGYGRIARAIAARARAFGMRIAAISRRPILDDVEPPDFAARPDQLPDVLRQSDFFVVAAPHTPETAGKIGAAELELLPRHAMLINVARAEIVDEQALYQALAAGRLAAAALDVWYRYPQPGGNGHGSELPFHTLPNVIATPHYSGWTQAMILRRVGQMTETLQRLERGEPLERVVFVGTWRG